MTSKVDYAPSTAAPCGTRRAYHQSQFHVTNIPPDAAISSDSSFSSTHDLVRAQVRQVPVWMCRT